MGFNHMEKNYYRKLKKTEINLSLFSNFNRYQEVKKCWRKENNEWILKDIAFTEQWGPTEYEYLIKCLKNTLETGGFVFGAFINSELVGFASLEKNLLVLKKNIYNFQAFIHLMISVDWE